MRIALDATYSVGSSLSGVGVYSREILNGLAASGAPVEWEWFYRSNKFWKAGRGPESAGVRRRLLADTFGSRSADLFHGLNQRLPARRFQKQICTFHDLFVLSCDYSTPDFRARFAKQAREAAERADLTIAVSAFTAGQMERFLGVPRERIRVVHHGLLPRKIPVLPRENLVLCVGAVQRRKNQAALVRAFRALPQDWRLVLAGAEGFESGETLEAIRASGCSGRIQITGYVSDEELAALYGRARIFAFPSLDEGFGIPLIEAMAAEVPVVTSNRSALPEVAGDAALLVNPEEDEEIAGALLRLANDERLREQLIAAGKMRAAQFTWSRAVGETLQAYEELAGPISRPSS